MGCPKPEELSAFALGKLNEPELERLAQHLDLCDGCQETIARLSVGDTFTAKLKQVPKGESVISIATGSPVSRELATAAPTNLPGRSGVGQRSAGSEFPGIVEACQLVKHSDTPTVDSPAFLRAVRQLHLASDAELTQLVEALTVDNRDAPQEVAQALVAANHITAFQATLLLNGLGAALVVGDYIVLDHLGSGGMGQVFRAQHRRMKRVVALKMLSSTALAKPELRERFQREVQAAARLIHPHIVTAFDAGEQHGQPYLVMEFVEGLDLATVLERQAPLPIDKVLGFVQQAARGLAFAHSTGVVHRDIKPANLLLGRDGVKILDLGLARLEDSQAVADQVAGEDSEASDLTHVGDVMGTIDYMAPEQVLNTGHADAKSDVYSLGCTLYRLLTGRRVYDGTTVMERVLAHREHPLPLASQHRPEIPAAVDQLIQRMIAKRPDERPTMQQIVERIDRLRFAEPTEFAVPTELATQPPESNTARANRGGYRRWIASVVVGLLLVACAVVVIRDRAGNKIAEITVPDDGFVTIESKPNVKAQSENSSAPLPAATNSTSINYALEFDGVAAHAIAEIADMKPPFTMEGWARLRSERMFQTAFHSSLGGQFSDGNFMAQTQLKYWNLKFVPENHGYSLPLPRAALRDDWVHFAFVVDTDQTLLPFLNGVTTEKPSKKERPANTADIKAIVLGASAGSPAFANVNNPMFFFDGWVDEVRISNVARYRGVFVPARRFARDEHTLALYHFDEGTGETFADEAGNCPPGRLLRGAKWVRVDTIAPPTGDPPNRNTGVFASSNTTTSTPRSGPSTPMYEHNNGKSTPDHALKFAGLGERAVAQLDARDWKPPYTFELWVNSEWGDRRRALEVPGVAWLAMESQRSPAGDSLLWRAGFPQLDRYIWTGSLEHALPRTWSHLAMCVNDAKEIRVFIHGKQKAKRSYDSVKPVSGVRELILGLSGVPTGTISKLEPVEYRTFNGLLDEVRLSSVVRYENDFTPSRRLEIDANTIALYHFDEGTGDEFNDSSNNLQHGKLVGATWVSTDDTNVPATPVRVTPVPMTPNSTKQ